MDYAAITANPQTGTLQLRGIFANPKGDILPGLFARIRAPFQQTQGALLVPADAVGFDQLGNYLLVIKDKNVVERRQVEIGEQVGEMRVIKSGLTVKDRVIIDGLLRAIPGREVSTGRGRKTAARAVSERGCTESRRWQPSRRPGMISTFFINRPIFANVIAIVTIILGAVALVNLPVAQYPEIVPTIQVTTNYPGGSADVVANTVGIPIEQAVNGVEGSIYMQSTSGSDGSYSLTVSFNRRYRSEHLPVAGAKRRQRRHGAAPARGAKPGVTVKKVSTNILMFVSLCSDDDRYDEKFLSNYAIINLQQPLARLPGVGQVNVLGAGAYGMRIWLDPNKMQSYGLTTVDVLNAVKNQNTQVAAGQLGAPPVPSDQLFQITLTTLGRLSTVESSKTLSSSRNSVRTARAPRLSASRTSPASN